MKVNAKSLRIIIKPTSVGLVILVIMTIILWLVLEPVIDYFYPPYLIVGMDIPAGSNTARVISSFLMVYFLGMCIAGFVSGFLLKRWGTKVTTRFWQSLVSGYIVGAFGPAFVMFLMSGKSLSIGVISLASTFGIPSALSSLFGYYLAGRKYKQSASK